MYKSYNNNKHTNNTQTHTYTHKRKQKLLTNVVADLQGRRRFVERGQCERYLRARHWRAENGARHSETSRRLNRAAAQQRELRLVCVRYLFKLCFAFLLKIIINKIYKKHFPKHTADGIGIVTLTLYKHATFGFVCVILKQNCF